jgi:transposase InsO family protein
VDMPWREQSLMDQRINFLTKAISGKCSFSSLCREFEISRTAGYKWIARFRASGSILEAAMELSRKPHHSPAKTPREQERRVVELRKQHGWGARKLRDRLHKDGLDLPSATIHRIIKREGLLWPRECHRPAVKRFEREAPNELWQIDFKGPFKTSWGHCHPLSILDDHSRYAIDIHALPYERAKEVKRYVITTFESNGLPDAILFDHGSLWWGTNSVLGLTWLSVWLLKQDIELIYSGVRHPQTQGKIERFHRTMAESVRHKGKPDSLADWKLYLDEFRESYNQERPHEALGMAVPASRYHPSLRQYNPNPKEWEYPTGTTVKRLDDEGMLEISGRRHFVCEALSGERVSITSIKNMLLIRFRATVVREINLDNRRTLLPKFKIKKKQV